MWTQYEAAFCIRVEYNTELGCRDVALGVKAEI